MIIVWLEEAQDGLIRLVRELRRSNPNAAKALQHRAVAATEHLAQFPYAGRCGAVEGTREVVLGDFPYIIFYRASSSEVQILGIRHSSQEWPI